MDWVWRNLGQIGELMANHLGVSVIPILAGFALSIPLGWAATRHRTARAVLLSFGGILYTIPSIALFVTLPAMLGTGILDPVNVVVALTLYAVAIMIRSAADAFASVPAEARESADALGYSPVRRFLGVDLPLAGPILLAGVRVVSVSTVSLATVGSVIGVSTLGNLFLDGFHRSFYLEIFVGIVLVLILATVFDLILVAAGRLLMPWTARPPRAPRAAVS